MTMRLLGHPDRGWWGWFHAIDENGALSGTFVPPGPPASAAAGWASRTVRPAGPALPARGAAPGAGTTAVGDGGPGCLHPGTGLAADLAGGGRVGQGRTVTTTV